MQQQHKLELSQELLQQVKSFSNMQLSVLVEVMKSKILSNVYTFLKTKQEVPAVAEFEDLMAFFESLKTKETHNDPIINQEVDSEGKKIASILELPSADKVKELVDSIINPQEKE